VKPFRVPSPRKERVAVVEPLAGRGVVDNGPYDVEPPTGVTMKFLCLAYGAEKDWKALTKDEQDALLAQDDVLRKRGALMAATSMCSRAFSTIGMIGKASQS
jgi:hypothetical protein